MRNHGPATPTPGRRALVLGGGGNTGIAWEAGVLDGLADGGVDPADSDLIVGTSAGAIVGAYLALGHSPRDLATHLLDRSRTRARPTFRGVAALGIAAAGAAVAAAGSAGPVQAVVFLAAVLAVALPVAVVLRGARSRRG